MAGSRIKPSEQTRVDRPQTAARAPAPEEAWPDLVMLLAEPEIRLVMKADGVNERDLIKTLAAISVQLEDRERRTGQTPARASARTASRSPRGRYRPGVGIVLLNQRGDIFVGRRIDMENDAWQMPQGGINRGESPRRAALRELREEIGTDKVEIIAESEHWLYYDVPAELAQKAWQGRWQGQRQKWFAMLLRAPESEIDLATEHPEFDAWRWVPAAELHALAASFKRQLYLDVLGEFAILFRD